MRVPSPPALMHGVGMGDVVKAHTSNGLSGSVYLVVDVGIATVTVSDKKGREVLASPWALVVVQQAPRKKVDSFPGK